MRKKQVHIEGISIKVKITVIIVCFVLASLSVAGLIASIQSRKALAEQAEAYLTQTAALKANEYSLFFDHISEEVQGIAAYASQVYSRPAVDSIVGIDVLMPWDGRGYGSPAGDASLAYEKSAIQQIGLVLKSLVGQNPFLSLGYYGSETNMTVFDDEETIGVILKLEGFVPTGRPWYAKAKAEGKTVWTEPYVDANTKKLVITCATPVFDQQQKILGVVGFDVLLDTIQQDVLALSIGYDSYAFLVADNGNVLVRPGMTQEDNRWDNSYASEDLLNTPNDEFNLIVLAMVDARSGLGRFAADDDQKYLAYVPIPAIGASLGLVASRSEVIRPALQMQRLILIVWGCVFALSIVVGLAIGNSITRPINDLTTMANLISQGKMDLDIITETRKDEIGVLTRSFNRLVTSLKIAMARS